MIYAQTSNNIDLQQSFLWLAMANELKLNFHIESLLIQFGPKERFFFFFSFFGKN